MITLWQTGDTVDCDTETEKRAQKVAWRIKVLASRPDDGSLIPRGQAKRMYIVLHSKIHVKSKHRRDCIARSYTCVIQLTCILTYLTQTLRVLNSLVEIIQ